MANKKNINDIFGRKAVVMSSPDDTWPLPAELVGIEIEVEDFEGNMDRTRPAWTVVNDGSLRNGLEFVLAAPLGGKQLTAAIQSFFNSGYRYNISERTSVHIHINASDNMTVDQFRNMFVLMYVLEPSVFRWADENRKWCGYCSPLTDLEPERLAGLLCEQRNGDTYFVKAVKGSKHHDRYYGFNIMAYPKHGTVEFRYFPCTKSEQALVEWVKFVMYVKKAAMVQEDPAALLTRLNTRDKLAAFLEANLGEIGPILSGLLDWDDAVGRVVELQNILLLSNEAIKRGGVYTERSKGFLKLIATTFPGINAQGDVNLEGGAIPSASEALREYLERHTAAMRERAEQALQAGAQARLNANVEWPGMRRLDPAAVPNEPEPMRSWRAELQALQGMNTYMANRRRRELQQRLGLDVEPLRNRAERRR